MGGSIRWTKEQLDARNAKQDRLRDGVKAIVDERKASKYRNKITLVDGIEFASKREARRYVELKNMQMSGQIGGLIMQCKIECEVNGVHVCDYVADFSYVINGRTVIEDSKGMRTDVFRLKKKLVAACTGIEVIEI